MDWRNYKKEISEMYTLTKLCIEPTTASLLEEADSHLLNRNSATQQALASDPTTSPEALDMLSRSEDSNVRCAVASNPACVATILEALAEDADVDVRKSVAENPSTPPEVLADLAHDDSLEVLHAVAWNPATSTQTLNDLAVREDWMEIREQVAVNPRATKYTLLLLALDYNRDVAERVLDNPSATRLHRAVVNGYEPDSATANLVKRLAQYDTTNYDDPEWLDRARLVWRIAASPTTPNEVLRGLMRRTDEFRWSLAENPRFDAIAQDMNVSRSLAYAGVKHNFTREQYEQFRDAPNEWVEALIHS